MQSAVKSICTENEDGPCIRGRCIARGKGRGWLSAGGGAFEGEGWKKVPLDMVVSRRTGATASRFTNQPTHGGNWLRGSLGKEGGW